MEKEEQEKGYLPVSVLLFLMAGIYGLLFFIQNIPGISYQGVVVYTASGLMCAAVWYLYYRHKELFYVFFAGMAAFVGYMCFTFRDRLLMEAGYVVFRLIGLTEAGSRSVTLLAVMSAGILVLLLFLLQIVVKRHGIIYLFLGPLLLAGPLFGVFAGVKEVLLLLIFQAVFVSAHMTGRAKKRNVLKGTGRERLACRTGVAMGLLLAAASVSAALLAYGFSEQLYQFVYQCEGYLSSSINTAMGRADDPVKGGHVSRGNNYRTGTEQLVLFSTKKPEEVMYLKGFEGGVYKGGEWQRADDSPLLLRVAQAMGWEQWTDMIENMYYRMYFVMNRNMWVRNRPAAGLLTVSHNSGNYENFYTPYYGQRINSSAYNWYGLHENGYGFWFYEQNEMNIRWTAPMGDFETERSWYYQLKEEYKKESQKAYTQVPVQLVPRLSELCKKNPQESLEAVTAFILYTLHSNAKYSLTPGWAAFNEDVVENFLFERKSGYCVHFASAAVLMYRLYGIPARYAAGYQVPASAFVEQEDGTYLASVTDEFAHAWVEIFLDEYGWTPVEVTPSSDGIATSYPGFDGQRLKELMKERGWNMEVPSIKENSTEKRADKRGTGLLESISLRGSEGRIVSFFAELMAYLLCFLPLILHGIRRRGRRGLEKMHSRAIFDRLLCMLHFGGLMTDCNGMEEDFTERLCVAIPVISQKQADRLRKIVLCAAYGNREETKEEQEYMREMFCRAAKDIYKRLRWDKKIVFRYGKAFW